MRGVKRLRPDAGFSDVFSAIPEAMQNALAQQFEALGPDVGLRLANLRTLLSSLTPQETRFMRLHLQSLPAPADIVSRFPADVLVEISPYLSALDIVNILNVSKTWRKAWSQRDVVRALAKHHMPNFLQFYAHRNRLQSPEDCTDQDLFNSFHQAARKFSIRQQGLFQSTISNPAPWLHFVTRDRFFTLEPTDSIKDWDDIFPDGDDDDFPDDFPGENEALPNPWRTFRYCNGKVAWQPDSDDDNLASLTFVDDLRSQQRKVYKVPVPVVLHGCVAELRDLGSELVVVSVNRTWYAWNLETGERDSVTLPFADIYQVRVEGKRAYILTDNSKVYVWTFRRGIREVDTSAAGEDGIDRVVNGLHDEPLLRGREDHGREGLFDILPHPLLDDTFYLLSFKEETGKLLVVHEFNHNGTLRLHTTTLPEVYSLTRKSGTGDFDFSLGPRRTGRNVVPTGDYFRTCTHKVDPYGNYAICQIFMQGELLKPEGFRGLYDESEIDYNYPAYLDGREDHWLGYTVFFNALTASVSTSPFIYHSNSFFFPPQPTCWGGQQIDFIRAPTIRKDLHFCMLLVSELNGQKRMESMDDLPVYCPSSLNSLREFLPVNHRFTERLANTPAKPGKMMHGYKCSNIVSRYLTERREVIPSIQPQYGLDITFEYGQLTDVGVSWEIDSSFKLMADDDFLVCRGPKGYVAWSFYHDMKDKNVMA